MKNSEKKERTASSRFGGFFRPGSYCNFKVFLNTHSILAYPECTIALILYDCQSITFHLYVLS